MLVTISSNKYLLKWQDCRPADFFQRAGEAVANKPWRLFRLLASWELLRGRCGSCPWLLGGQGDSGPQPHGAESWLALWECERGAGRDFTPCSLSSRPCVCVCTRIGGGPGRQGTEEPSIFLKAYIQAGMKDGSQSITSSCGDLPDFCEDEILLQKGGG